MSDNTRARAMVAALIFVMANAIVFGAGLVTVLAVPTLAEHASFWIPVVVLGVAGIAALIRIMRANLLDELHKPYVETGRAKGLPELTLVLRYPVRVALNPFISTVGWVLPTLVSGDVIVATVLSLPTAGPILIQALKTQDQYLAGALLLFQCIFVLIGTLLSDLLLAWLDPRIRYDQ